MNRCIICRVRARLLFELQDLLWHFDVVQFQHEQRLCINAETIMRYFHLRGHDN